MENNNLLLKVSRFFPSSLMSCQPQTDLPSVADSSVIITKTRRSTIGEDDRSIQQNPPKPGRISRKQLLNHSSNAGGRRCPPVTPASTIEDPRRTVGIRNHSSPSNSGRWFTSSDEVTRDAEDGYETDTFFSRSSVSGESFRPKTTGRRFMRKCEEMKRKDETGRCSCDTVTGGGGGRRSAAGCGDKKSSVARSEYEVGSDHASTRLYYQNSLRLRRTKTGKNRRRFGKSPSRRSCSDGSVIEESFAVEKSSSDPYSDFMASMVEMIIEKQMFGAEDLDRLLFRFLSLNETDNHGIIFEVFSEICRTLFSD
ncbi:hypothetical protein OROHE_013746 [Orobanche hederae]